MARKISYEIWIRIMFAESDYTVEVFTFLCIPYVLVIYPLFPLIHYAFSSDLPANLAIFINLFAPFVLSSLM